MSPGPEAILWEARPRPRPLEASDWVFHAQWLAALLALALVLPSVPVSLGPVRLWRWTIPLLSPVLVAYHWVHRRSRTVAVSADALWIREGVLWPRTERHDCPAARLATRVGRAPELRGEGGVRLPLEGLDALDLADLRSALGSAEAEAA